MGHYVSNSNTGKGAYALPFSTSPQIIVSKVVLPNFGNVATGSFGVVQAFTVSGINLTRNVVVTAPTGFISNTDGTNTNGSPITLNQVNGVLPVTTIYVNFNPSLAQAYSGNISIVSIGTPSKTVGVSGTGI